MRIEGWEKLLYEHIHNGHASVFEWGQNDCALWSADWVRKATGVDLGAEWRGTYTTEAELHALLKTKGYASPTDIANDKLRHIPLNFAQRGDIVLHPHGVLGICDGIVSYFLTERGVTRLHTHACAAAWKV